MQARVHDRVLFFFVYRSRNVFLRVSDGKKYCYYSMYAWGSTFSMALLAMFAHLVLDTNTLRKELKEVTESAIGIVLFWFTCASFNRLLFY